MATVLRFASATEKGGTTGAEALLGYTADGAGDGVGRILVRASVSRSQPSPRTFHSRA